MRRQPKHRKSIILRLLVLGVSVYMVATLIGLGNQLSTESAELAKLEQKRDSLIRDNEEYRDLLNGDRDKIIEDAARERLGYVYSNEIVYIDTSGN
ncbi:MAG: septum formation initiator family protein [Clostridia bacterium]|nr:septum formation initiator family protein [Clostridia bacterium]